MSFIIFRPSIDSLVERAQIQCEIWHGDQKRKYSGAPYWTHPREVASILARCDVKDPEILAAAYLHDVLEDTPYGVPDIYRIFGQRVTDLVVELTDDKIEGNRAFRKAHDAQRLLYVSNDAKTIKCADLISNTSDICKHDPQFARVYLKEKENVLASIWGGADPVLSAWAHRSMEQGWATLGGK